MISRKFFKCVQKWSAAMPAAAGLVGRAPKNLTGVFFNLAVLELEYMV